MLQLALAQLLAAEGNAHRGLFLLVLADQLLLPGHQVMGGSVQPHIVALGQQKFFSKLRVQLPRKRAVQQRLRKLCIGQPCLRLGVILHFCRVKGVAAVQIAADERQLALEIDPLHQLIFPPDHVL